MIRFAHSGPEILTRLLLLNSPFIVKHKLGLVW